jgi:hypothetical protein
VTSYRDAACACAEVTSPTSQRTHFACLQGGYHAISTFYLPGTAVNIQYQYAPARGFCAGQENFQSSKMVPAPPFPRHHDEHSGQNQ